MHAQNGSAPAETARQALAVAVLAVLLGAVLGGLAGMRFHRNVDKAGLGK